MNLKGFFVATLSSALDLNVATPDDVLRHATPDVLANHLPRALWARLLTACLGAPRVDAQLVVETIGVPNLCEHVPANIIWACINEIGRRTIGLATTTTMTTTSTTSATSTIDDVVMVHERRRPLTAPPPPIIATGTPLATPVLATNLPAPTIPSPNASAINPLADVAADLEAGVTTTSTTPTSSGGPSRARTPSAQRFRQSPTGIGRLAPTGLTNPRRPQAAAPVASPLPSVLGGSGGLRSPNKTPPPPAEPDAYEVVTELGREDWKNALAVEDEQLVDWSAADETISSDDFTGGSRKR